MTVKTKICGVTTVGDAQAAAQAGVDYIGLNFCPRSKRHVSLQRAEAIAECLVARSGGTRLVGVFVNQSHIEIDYILKRLDLDFVQMHGDESTSSVAAYRGRVIKAVFLRSEDDVRRISDFPTDMILVDTPSEQAGGSGEVGDRDLAAASVASGKQIFLAGGLTPKNVSEAIRHVRPYAVDVASGVERAPGVKDHELLRSFIDAARGAL